MANRLQIKRNVFGQSGAPGTNDLLTGELAYDGASQKLYIGRQTANNGQASDVTTTDLGATIVPVATSNQKGVVKIDTTDFNIANDGGLSLATTSTAAELNLVDGASAGTVVNSKAAIYGSSGELNMTTLQIGGTSVTSTAAELNLVDGVTAGTASASKAVILDGNKDLTGMRNLTLTGDLTVEGDTVTLNTSTLTVEDKVVEIGKNATNSSTSDGAGIIVGGWSGCPSILYDDDGTQWELNKNTDVTGTFKCSGAATLTGGIANTTLNFGTYTT
tara:strand:- start:428 stop:1252 length:825 start_codon:yes stop_codon:yes gene_type:complete